jgi:hypothetical protein
MAALRRGGKDDLQLHAQEIAQNNRRQHLDIATRVPDPTGPAIRGAPQTQKIAEADRGQSVRQPKTKHGDLLTQRALDWNQLDDGGRHARETALEIGSDDLDVPDIGHESALLARAMIVFWKERNGAKGGFAPAGADQPQLTARIS